jgi:hypothetical protein
MNPFKAKLKYSNQAQHLPPQGATKRLKVKEGLYYPSHGLYKYENNKWYWYEDHSVNYWFIDQIGGQWREIIVDQKEVKQIKLYTLNQGLIEKRNPSDNVKKIAIQALKDEFYKDILNSKELCND